MASIKKTAWKQDGDKSTNFGKITMLMFRCV